MSLYRLNNLASSVSLFAITIGLVVGQSATQKSLALDGFATSPAAAPATLSINGAGASSVNTLFVGTGAANACPFGSKGSWFNVFGVGNPPSLNADLTATTNGCAIGTYGPVVPNDTFRYASVGSGSGVTTFFAPPGPAAPAAPVIVPVEPNPDNNIQILNQISFAASDGPLAGTDIERIAGGTASQRTGSGKAIQVPVVGVGIALAFNRNGLNVPAAGLKLSRKSYCGIFTGNITNWNDASIRADNGGAIIAANLLIKVVRRSDNSGSTFVVSNALNHICQTSATPGLPAAYVWNRGVGEISLPTPPAPVAPAIYSNPPYSPACTLPAATNTVCWPNTFIGTSGGGNVAKVIGGAAGVPNTPVAGAIGYVDSATRLANNLPAALLQNKSGAYVGPTVTGIQDALSASPIVKYGTAPDRRLVRVDVSDPTSATAYPFSTATYMLFYDVYANATISDHLKGFINWSLGNTPVSNPTADAIATARGYAPLPANIKTVSREVVNTCVNTVVGPSPCSTTP